MKEYTILEEYTKAQKVITSCTNLIHLQSAKKYVSLFLNNNKETQKYYYGKPKFSFIWEYYLKLRKYLDEKEDRIMMF